MEQPEWIQGLATYVHDIVKQHDDARFVSLAIAFNDSSDQRQHFVFADGIKNSPEELAFALLSPILYTAHFDKEAAKEIYKSLGEVLENYNGIEMPAENK